MLFRHPGGEAGKQGGGIAALGADADAPGPAFPGFLLDQAVREKRTQPRAIMQRIPPQLALQTVANAEQSPFFAPFTRFTDSIGEADRARLSAAGRAAIERTVLPAYARLSKAFNERYLPATRESVGINDTPEGAAFYRERIAFHTTSSALTADQIHAIGLAEVARIRGEMIKIKDQVGFKGSLQEFFVFLRTDPQFYYKTGQELLEGYLAVSKRIDPNLVLHKKDGRPVALVKGGRPIGELFA